MAPEFDTPIEYQVKTFTDSLHATMALIFLSTSSSTQQYAQQINYMHFLPSRPFAEV